MPDVHTFRFEDDAEELPVGGEIIDNKNFHFGGFDF